MMTEAIVRIEDPKANNHLFSRDDGITHNINTIRVLCNEKRKHISFFIIQSFINCIKQQNNIRYLQSNCLSPALTTFNDLSFTYYSFHLTYFILL